MSRLNNSPDLFGSGAGHTTCNQIRCEWCGKVHNRGVPDDGPQEGDWVRHTMFAGKEVCECCWEKIEEEIALRMPDILEWYTDLIGLRKRKIEVVEAVLKEAKAAHSAYKRTVARRPVGRPKQAVKKG